MTPLPIIANSSPWLDTIHGSPLTPWIGGALLIFVAFTLIKMAVKFFTRLVIIGLMAMVGFLGWNWWEQPRSRTFADINNDWFASVKNTDFSSTSIEALMKDSSKLLSEAVAVGRGKGREASKEALRSMCTALEAKIEESSKQGKLDAKARFQEVLAKVREQLKSS